MAEIHQQDIDRLIRAIERLSCGGRNDAPLGFEALSMSINGSPLNQPSLTDGLFAIASSIGELANAVRDIELRIVSE